jgi:hypothetical protein
MALRLAVVMLLVPLAAAAQMYTWTDEQGVQHFTDDPNTVPRKAKARTTEGAYINVLSSTEKEEGSSVAAPQGLTAVHDAAAQAKAAAAQAQAAASAQAKETVEDVWRRRFREAHARIREFEDEIEADRKKVEELDGLPVVFGWTCPTGWGAPYAGPGSNTAGGVLGAGVSVAGGARRTSNAYAWPLRGSTRCYAGFNSEYEWVRERLARNRRALDRAKDDLKDLERRAANEAVPLEWRR